MERALNEMGTCDACKDDRCTNCSGRYSVAIKRKGIVNSTTRHQAVCECHHGHAIDVALVEGGGITLWSGRSAA